MSSLEKHLDKMEAEQNEKIGERGVPSTANGRPDEELSK